MLLDKIKFIWNNLVLYFTKTNSKPQLVLTNIPSKKEEENTVTMRKFDGIVHSLGADGQHHRTNVTGLSAASAKQLVALYRATGEEIEITAEYDEQGNLITGQNIPAAPATQQVVNQPVPQQVAQQPTSPVVNQPVTQQIPVQQPDIMPTKYFQIGTVECKFENGKVYQKQWVRLTDKESANLRVLNDLNNKIVSLTGKHIEALKWVAVENDSDQPQTTL